MNKVAKWNMNTRRIIKVIDEIIYTIVNRRIISGTVCKWVQEAHDWNYNENAGDHYHKQVLDEDNGLGIYIFSDTL